MGYTNHCTALHCPICDVPSVSVRPTDECYFPPFSPSIWATFPSDSEAPSLGVALRQKPVPPPPPASPSPCRRKVRSYLLLLFGSLASVVARRRRVQRVLGHRKPPLVGATRREGKKQEEESRRERARAWLASLHLHASLTFAEMMKNNNFDCAFTAPKGCSIKSALHENHNF